MRRILVVCYSRNGTTLEVAQTIAERCGADVELIKDKIPRHGGLGYLRSAFEALFRRTPWIRPPRRWRDHNNWRRSNGRPHYLTLASRTRARRNP